VEDGLVSNDVKFINIRATQVERSVCPGDVVGTESYIIENNIVNNFEHWNIGELVNEVILPSGSLVLVADASMG
jgi:hypothetical protein